MIFYANDNAKTALFAGRKPNAIRATGPRVIQLIFGQNDKVDLVYTTIAERVIGGVVKKQEVDDRQARDDDFNRICNFYGEVQPKAKRGKNTDVTAE